MSTITWPFYQKILYLAVLCITRPTISMELPLAKNKFPSHLRVKNNVLNLSNTSLINATINNNEAEVIRLLKLAVDPNEKNGHKGCAALHYAAYNGYISIGKFLIAYNADVNIQNNAGNSPLYYAINSLTDAEEKNSEQVVEFIRLLLKQGARTKIKNVKEMPITSHLATDLYSPANEKNTEIHETIIKQCSDENKKHNPYATSLCIRASNLSTKKSTKEKRLYINRAHALIVCARLKKLAQRLFGEKLLWQAAQNNNEMEIQRLLDAGVKVTATDSESGNTALHYAAQRGYIKIGKILLISGARVNAKNHARFTPLHNTIVSFRIEQKSCLVDFIELLLNYGAQISHKDIHYNLTKTILNRTMSHQQRLHINHVHNLFYRHSCMISRNYLLKLASTLFLS